MTGKLYLKVDVYTALQQRLNFLFSEFDYIHIAFSGGKDSGVLLNLTYDYAKSHNCVDKLSVNFNDCEVQYQYTIDYVKDTFSHLAIKKYWICVPFSVLSATSMKDGYWIPWDKDKKDLWVRKMPRMKYVINEDNVPFKFEKGMQDHKVENSIDNWIASKNEGKTVVLLGIRADESLNRYRAIKSDNKVNSYKGINYINKKGKYYTAYPLYDWKVTDIWTANAKFGYSYNKVYDLFYRSGIPLREMRVASPFTTEALDSLKYYKQIEPKTWDKMLSRVNGVNFASMYGNTKVLGNKPITKPDKLTWEEYAKLLIETIPEKTAKLYKTNWNSEVKDVAPESFYKIMAFSILKNEQSKKYIYKRNIQNKIDSHKQLVNKYNNLL